jgi:hypothetical protein
MGRRSALVAPNGARLRGGELYARVLVAASSRRHDERAIVVVVLGVGGGGGVAIASAALTVSRKPHHRQCHHSKARCGGDGINACAGCTRKGIPCVYRWVACDARCTVAHRSHSAAHLRRTGGAAANADAPALSERPRCRWPWLCRSPRV